MIACRRCLAVCSSCHHYWHAVICDGSIIGTPVGEIFKVSLLKDEQKEAVRHLCSKNMVGILPTGFRKSLIYQLYATAKQMQEDGNVVVLVVLPLKSIMNDQIESLGRHNFYGITFGESLGQHNFCFAEDVRGERDILLNHSS